MPQAARPARPRPEDPAARRRRIGAILLAIVAALAIAAVLSSAGGVESGDVADVEDAGTVSKQDFDHWLVVVSSQPQPGQKKPSKPPKPGSAQYDAVKQQVMQFLVSAKWIDGEAKERGLSATDAEVKRQFEQTKDQSFPNDKAYQRFLKTSGQTEEDLLFRVRLDVLSNKIRQQVTEESAERLRQRDRGLLQRQRAAVLTARAARPRGDPDQEPGQGARGQEGGRRRPEVVRRSQGVLRRPRLQGAGRQAARCLEGPAGPEVRRGHLRRRAGPGRGPGQDRRRLLRLPRHQGDEGHQAGPRAVQAGHQAAAGLAEAAEGSSTTSPRTSATPGASAPTATRSS